MKLYHGTDKTFTEPDLGRARDNTDFGNGFYLTEKEGAAKDWVKDRNTKNVNIYDLTLEDIPSCKLHVKRYDVDEKWAKYVYNNRKGLIRSNKYDIVIGPIADNGLNKLFDKIDRKEVTFKDIAPKLRLMRFNAFQFCFKTDNALKLLEYVSRK